MKFYDYILTKYHELGNLSTETKEKIISRMLVSEFGIPNEIALMAVKYTEIAKIAAFHAALNSLSSDIVTLLDVA